MLIKGTTRTIFITSLVWRGLWLGIEPGTFRTRSQHYTTRLSRRRSLTGDWTRDLPHSEPALYHKANEEAVIDCGLNPGPSALGASTIPQGYRGGDPWLGIEPGTFRTRSQHYTTRLSRRRSLTGDWTRDLPHSEPALYHKANEEAVIDCGLNPGPSALGASTIPQGYRGGDPWLGIEPGTFRTRSQHYTTRLSRRRYLNLMIMNILLSTY